MELQIWVIKSFEEERCVDSLEVPGTMKSECGDKKERHLYRCSWTLHWEPGSWKRFGQKLQRLMLRSGFPGTNHFGSPLLMDALSFFFMHLPEPLSRLRASLSALCSRIAFLQPGPLWPLPPLVPHCCPSVMYWAARHTQPLWYSVSDSSWQHMPCARALSQVICCILKEWSSLLLAATEEGLQDSANTCRCSRPFYKTVTLAHPLT